MIKKYNDFIKESLINKLEGPSIDEIEKNLEGIKPDDLIFKCAKSDYLIGVKRALEMIRKDGDDGINFPNLILQDTVAYGSMEVLKYLIEEENASVDGYYGHNLENAASNDHPEIIKYLLSKGANPDVNKGGPLWRSVSYGFIECTEVLLEGGAKMEEYMIQKAISNGNEKMVALLNKYKDTNYVDEI